MSLRHGRAILVAVSCLALVAGWPAFATSCVCVEQTLQAEVARSAVIIVGRIADIQIVQAVSGVDALTAQFMKLVRDVDSIDDLEIVGGESRVAIVVVEDSLKGDHPKIIEVRVSALGTPCGIRLKLGKRYLIFATQDTRNDSSSSTFATSGCSRTRKASRARKLRHEVVGIIDELEADEPANKGLNLTDPVCHDPGDHNLTGPACCPSSTSISAVLE